MAEPSATQLWLTPLHPSDSTTSPLFHHSVIDELANGGPPASGGTRTRDEKRSKAISEKQYARGWELEIGRQWFDGAKINQLANEQKEQFVIWKGARMLNKLVAVWNAFFICFIYSFNISLTVSVWIHMFVFSNNLSFTPSVTHLSSTPTVSCSRPLIGFTWTAADQVSCWRAPQQCM